MFSKIKTFLNSALGGSSSQTTTATTFTARQPLPDPLISFRLALDDDDDLRVKTKKSTKPTNKKPPETTSAPLLLLFLRTMIPLQKDDERHHAILQAILQQQQQHFVPLFLEQFVLSTHGNEWTSVHRPVILETILPLRCLITLDIRGLSSHVNDAFLTKISASHPQLRRLYLWMSPASQASLNAFRNLEELNVTYCKNINNVHFCASSLRVLYANQSGVNDEGLVNAVHLEELHVAGCVGVTSLAPFGRTLRVLEASGKYNGVKDCALRQPPNLVELDISDNPHVTTVQPFCRTLRHLRAQWDSGLDDAGIASATNLVTLDVSANRNVTVIPSESLKELDASVYDLRACGISSESLQSAPCPELVKLSVANNDQVSSVAPFARSLRWLNASGPRCSITNTALMEVKQLVYLDRSQNRKVTVTTADIPTLRFLKE